MKLRILSIITAAIMLAAMVPCFSFAAHGNSKVESLIKVEEPHKDNLHKTIKAKLSEDEDDDDYSIEDAEEEIKEDLKDEFDDLKSYEKKLKTYYSKGVKTAISNALTDMDRMLKECTIEELGYTVASYYVEDGFSMIDIDVDPKTEYNKDMTGVEELLQYWSKEYISDASKLSLSKAAAKKSIKSYFAVKSGTFNEYYQTCLNGQKSECLNDVDKAKKIIDCAVARSYARGIYENWIYYYAPAIKEPVSPIFVADDDWDDDWDDEDWGDEESFDEDFYISGLGTMSASDIESYFDKSCEDLDGITDWGKLPKGVKVESHSINSGDLYMSIDEMNDNVKEAKAIFDLYISRQLAGHDVDLSSIKAERDKCIKKMTSAANAEEQAQAFTLSLEKIIDISGIDIDVFNTTEIGRMQKGLEEAFDKYFVAGKYTKNGYKQLYRLYAYAYTRLDYMNYKMFAPAKYLDKVLGEMAKVPEYLPENKTAYTAKLKKYIGDKKYVQSKVKPIVNEGIAKIKKAKTVKDVESIYTKYKKKAEATIKKFKISTSKTGKGTISASKTVKYGSSATIKIRAAKGYKLGKLTVDGKKIKKTTKYTFKNVKKSHTIKATFVKKK